VRHVYGYDDQIKKDEMGTACSTHGDKRNMCKILVSKPKIKI